MVHHRLQPPRNPPTQLQEMTAMRKRQQPATTTLAQTLSALLVASALVAPATQAVAAEPPMAIAANPCGPDNPCGPAKKKKKKTADSGNPCAPSNPCAPKK